MTVSVKRLMELLAIGETFPLTGPQSKIAVLLENKDLVMTDDNYVELCTRLEDAVGICFLPEELKRILFFYPMVTIDVAWAGAGDTAALSGILNALADFFLDTEWPMNKDNIDRDWFHTVFVNQVKTAGFNVSTPN